jgi:hypothetical protein
LPAGEIFVESQLLQNLAEKRIAKEALFTMVETDFGLLPEVFGGVSSPKASVRYGCASVLVDLSAKYPEKLYPHMDKFTALLDSKHRILTWNAMAAIANLCSVDKDQKFDAIFNKYFGFLNNEYLVTVANVVSNSGKIAAAKPYLIPKITGELCKVENISTTPHLTEECKRVIAEKTVEAFNQFYNKMSAKDKAKAVSFVKRQTGSSRKTLREKAELFLKQRGK